MALQQETQKGNPRTVQTVKRVDLALVSYADHNGEVVNQFAVVGDSTVLLLDNKEFAGTSERSPSGWATGWLKDQVLAQFHKKAEEK